jgi:signal transduction histidine kinase
MRAKQEADASDAGNEVQGLSLRSDACDADTVLAARDSEILKHATSSLSREKDRLAAFEIELRCLSSTSPPSSIGRDLAHELRGILHAITLQVESIKEDLECSAQDLPCEIAVLEGELGRLKRGLKQLLEASARTSRNQEALG